MTAGWPALALAALGSAAASALVLLTVFIGFCVLFAFFKLRHDHAGAHVVRSLDERLGGRTLLLPADAPRGFLDQLATPELRERASRKS